MKTLAIGTGKLISVNAFLLMIFLNHSCQNKSQEGQTAKINAETKASEKPEYFSLRPEVEKTFGYSHAVKIGNHIKISGAVSMDENGNPTAVGDMGQQMKNIYSDLKKILTHYDCTFDNVIVENIYTTDMPKFLENARYRNDIYTENFPTGTWVGVKELAIPVFIIEIELEAYKEN